MSDAVISSLHVYPVKSTTGIELESADVGPRGLAYDRRWALIGEDGEVITAREFPDLLGVRTEIGRGELVVSYEGKEQLRLPLQMDTEATIGFTVFDSPATGLDVGNGVGDWFADLLGASCRMVYMNDGAHRHLLPEHGGKAGDLMSYADQCPLLLISRASLKDLNTRLETPVSMRNFRPNIVVAECDQYAEDRWRTVRIGGITFDVSQQCQRCVFTTIDPDTREKHPLQEPLRTLSRYRRLPQGGVAFGVHLIPRSTGSLKTGDILVSV